MHRFIHLLQSGRRIEVNIDATTSIPTFIPKYKPKDLTPEEVDESIAWVNITLIQFLQKNFTLPQIMEMLQHIM